MEKWTALIMAAAALITSFTALWRALTASRRSHRNSEAVEHLKTVVMNGVDKKEGR